MKKEARKNKKQERGKQKDEIIGKKEEGRKAKQKEERRRTKIGKKKLWGLRAVSITGEDLKKGGEIESFF